jgi:MYXO-CTERM domain-containing protein
VGVRQPISVESELSFGQQLLNTTSRPRTLHIVNNTDTNLTLTDVVVEGTGSSQFEPEALGTTILKPGTPQPLNVTFTPQSETEVNCRLKLYIPELGQQIEVAVQGKGIPKVISVTPEVLDFGGVRIGSDKREQPLTIMNLSSDPITLAMPEVKSKSGASFIFDGDSLRNMQLAPGVPVIVNVGYQPTVESTSETILSFGTTSPPKPQAVDVLLKGRATKRVLSADQQALDFGWVNVNTKTVEPKVITITNKSTQLQRVVVMLKAGEDAPFILDTNALAGGIPPEGSASFTVAFKPQQSGDAANEVQIYLDGESEPEVQIAVKGIGRALSGEGSGCSCGTTEAGSAGMLMLLALVGLGSRRRRRG